MEEFRGGGGCYPAWFSVVVGYNNCPVLEHVSKWPSLLDIHTCKHDALGHVVDDLVIRGFCQRRPSVAKHQQQETKGKSTLGMRLGRGKWLTQTDSPGF